MLEKEKKQKKGTISEDDISALLQRYSATTVLALLQEVAQFPEVKIDWNELVKKTTTGISSAREYQMLWRHLAYRDSLVERLDDGAELLDDDSDLDYELEALPPVNNEASVEAAACVKVLIASGLQSDTSLQNGSIVEAPLTINIPNGQLFRAPQENSQLQGTNITIPISIQKQPVPNVTPAEGLDGTGSVSGSVPSRRKRKPWSTEEDMELIAAVQKCGEGNWANILKGDFKGDRTASQLSQRWAIIRKRQGTLNVGGGSSQQLSEAQLAARRAVSLALNMPMVDNLTAACSNAGTNQNTSNNSAWTASVEPSSVGFQSQPQSRPDSAPTSLSKSRIIPKKQSAKPAVSADAMVKAAAVAAGARIATPSDAASLFQAAQAKNAVHIMPGGGSVIKSTMAGSANPLPPNVHFIRTGLASTSSSVYPPVSTNAPRPGGAHQTHSNSLKPVSQTGQPNSMHTARESNPSAEVTNAAATDSKANNTTNSSSSHPPRKQVQADQVSIAANVPREQVQETQVSVSGEGLKEEVVEDLASVPSNAANKHPPDVASDLNDQMQEDQTTLCSSETLPKSQMDFVENSQCSSSTMAAGDCQIVTDGKEIAAGVDKRDDSKTIELPVGEGSGNQSKVGKT